MYPDYLLSVNNFQINDNPYDAIQVDEELYLMHGSFWSDNGLVQVNPNSFEIKRHINLGRSICSYSGINLGGNRMLIAGDEADNEYNVLVADLNAVGEEGFVQEQLYTGFNVNSMLQVGDNIFMATSYSNSPLMMLDANNLSQEGLTTLSESFTLTNRNNKFVRDKNNNVWIPVKAGSGVKLVVIDGKTGAFTKELAMPNSVSSINETAIAISNDGATLYARSHKAFYTIDVDNTLELDEPNFEYREHVGSLKNLKMTEEGTLVFLNQKLGSFTPSEVIELTITSDENWDIKIHNVGYNASVIFVPNYAKGSCTCRL